MVKSFYFGHSCHYFWNNFQYPNTAIVSTCSVGEMNCTKDEEYRKHPTKNSARSMQDVALVSMLSKQIISV